MRRTLYLTAGIASVALGVIGAFLPILPTVPFLILAAFCFGKSHPEWEARLLNHPRYGKSLRLWREHGAISRVGKVGATVAFTGSAVMGFVFLALPWSLVPLGVGLMCGSWIWTRPEG